MINTSLSSGQNQLKPNFGSYIQKFNIIPVPDEKLGMGYKFVEDSFRVIKDQFDVSDGTPSSKGILERIKMFLEDFNYSAIKEPLAWDAEAAISFLNKQTKQRTHISIITDNETGNKSMGVRTMSEDGSGSLVEEVLTESTIKNEKQTHNLFNEITDRIKKAFNFFDQEIEGGESLIAIVNRHDEPGGIPFFLDKDSIPELLENSPTPNVTSLILREIQNKTLRVEKINPDGTAIMRFDKSNGEQQLIVLNQKDLKAAIVH